MAQDGALSVALEWYEITAAAQVAVLRNVEALRQGKRSKRGKDAQWERHVLGALGECAFCKATGRYWSGSVNSYQEESDVGKTLQVRTRSSHSYDLIIRSEDKDEDVFVLVTGGPAEFTVHGWLLGKDGKKSKFLNNHGGYGAAYFVPQDRLRSAKDLVIKDSK